MAIYDKQVTGGNGINYTKEVDGSGDYTALPNDTYFKDLSDGLIKWKDGSGNVLSIFSLGGGTTDYLFGFYKTGAVSGNTLIQPTGNDGVYTSNVGILVTRNMTLKEIGFSFGVSSAAASETFTVTIRKQAIGIGVTGSGTQHVLGGGTLVASLGLASGGALVAAYNRNNVDTGLSVALNAGDFLYAEVSNFAFWSISDLQINLKANI